jgi:hypothetical protein
VVLTHSRFTPLHKTRDGVVDRTRLARPGDLYPDVSGVPPQQFSLTRLMLRKGFRSFAFQIGRQIKMLTLAGPT